VVEDQLRREIEKWSKRLDEEIPKISGTDKKGAEFMENIKAYQRDSNHFLERGDLVNSFECLIWAWALLETGRGLGHLTVA